MGEGTPGQVFHSQKIPPALHLTAFLALTAAQLQPFCIPLPLPSNGNRANSPLKRQSSSAHHLPPEADRQSGWKEALARAPHWHILTRSSTAKQSPKASVRNCTGGFFNELKILSSEGSGIEFTCRDVYPCVYVKHGYTVKKPQQAFSSVFRFGILLKHI